MRLFFYVLLYIYYYFFDPYVKCLAIKTIDLVSYINLSCFINVKSLRNLLEKLLSFLKRHPRNDNKTVVMK